MHKATCSFGLASDIASDVTPTACYHPTCGSGVLPQNPSSGTVRCDGGGGVLVEMQAHIATPRLRFPAVQRMPAQIHSQLRTGEFYQPRVKTDYQGSIPALNTKSSCPRSTPKSPPIFRQCILVSSIGYYETVPCDDRYSREWCGPASNTPSVPQIHLPPARDDFYSGDTKDQQSLFEMMEEFEQAVDLTLREPLTTSLPDLSADFLSRPLNTIYSSGLPDELWSPVNITEYNTGVQW